jgi:hypothetical protein
MLNYKFVYFCNFFSSDYLQQNGKRSCADFMVVGFSTHKNQFKEANRGHTIKVVLYELM